MLTTSVEAICFNYRPKKDNTYPIMLRLTKSGKRKYVSLEVSVKEEDWDFKKNVPKRSCQEKELILSIIEKRIAEYRERINEYRVENKDYTLETLVQRTENPVRSMTVGSYLDLFITQLKDENRLGCRQDYTYFTECLPINDDGQSGNAANEGLMTAQMKAQQSFLKQLSWVPCDRTERIRRSRARRLKHPASTHIHIR